MRLGEEEIRDIIESPRGRDTLAKASELQRRVRFHTEPNVRFNDISQPASDFLDWVKGLLPGDKYRTFLQLMRFPTDMPSFVGSVYRDLERVFDSRDSSFVYQFADSSLEEDWRRYRTDVLREPTVWREEGMEMVKCSPNSILVVDAKEERESGRLSPYFYWLQIDCVVDFLSKRDSAGLEYVVFRQPGDRFAVVDDDSVRVFDKDPEEDNIGKLVREFRHGLGYCPAAFFWNSSVGRDALDLKANPITEVLSKLDWLLFFTVSKKQLDMYASYPIYSAYEADCDYENNETHEYCDGGYLRSTDTKSWIFDSAGALCACPVCGSRRITGPGSFIEVPVPSGLDGTVDLSEPIHITGVDKDSLRYNVDETVRLQDEIRTLVAGQGKGDVTRKEAINETQAHANFEEQTDILRAFARNFEAAQRFVDDTVCRLRYGSDYIGCSINWGTEFYLYTAEELWGKYKSAKDNGALESILDEIMNQIVEVENKDNPAALKRMQVLKQLEPYKHKTLQEVQALYKEGLCSKTDVLLKVNFTDYVEEFEREQASVLVFGSDMERQSDKINKIKQILKSYAKRDESRTTDPQPSGDGGGVGGPTKKEVEKSE